MPDRPTIPIACSLTAEELPERRALLGKLGQAVSETQERVEGYAYRFESDALLPEILEIVRAERECCPFLRFSLIFEPGNGPLWLEVTGSEDTKEFVASFLS
jgi:hypothetical protein